MSIDIREGDYLVVGSVEYPVKSVAEYTGFKTSSTFARMAIVDASTKRLPAITGGKRGARATNLTGLKCTPLDPVSAELRQRMALDSAVELKQTFLADADGYVHLVVEQLKR